MSDLQPIADRVEIEALRGSATLVGGSGALVSPTYGFGPELLPSGSG
jgi:hypothetical protein